MLLLEAQRIPENHARDLDGSLGPEGISADWPVATLPV